MKRILCLAIAVLMLLCGCGGDGGETTPTTVPTTVVTEPVILGTVGICLADETDYRQTESAAAMEALFLEAGYRVRILYGENSVLTQSEQIRTLVTEKVDCLIVGAVDPMALGEPLREAENAGIPVVAYDQLLMDSKEVDAFVGFDYYSIGITLGQKIIQQKALEDAVEECYTIEFFMGAPEDPNAQELYRGLMKELQPYLVSGVLTSLSGRTAFEDCCIPGWDAELAKIDCEAYLTEYYADTMPDIFCVAGDTLAAGLRSALAQAETTPLVMGEWITPDSRLLAEPTVDITLALIAGESLPVNVAGGVNNRAKNVPAWHVAENITE